MGRGRAARAYLSGWYCPWLHERASLGARNPCAVARDPAEAWSNVRAGLPPGPTAEPGHHIFQNAVALLRLGADLALDDGDLPTAAAPGWQGSTAGSTGAAPSGGARMRLLWARYHRVAGDPERAWQTAEEPLEEALRRTSRWHCWRPTGFWASSRPKLRTGTRRIRIFRGARAGRRLRRAVRAGVDAARARRASHRRGQPYGGHSLAGRSPGDRAAIERSAVAGPRRCPHGPALRATGPARSRPPALGPGGRSLAPRGGWSVEP